nr:uncharacterized protein C10orf143 homolog isoform X2 [Equus asinus]
MTRERRRALLQPIGETGMQKTRRSCAGVGLRPGEGQHPGLLERRGAGVEAQRLPPCGKARERPGAARHGDSSEWWRELGPALPEMCCGRIYSRSQSMLTWLCLSECPQVLLVLPPTCLQHLSPSDLISTTPHAQSNTSSPGVLLLRVSGQVSWPRTSGKCYVFCRALWRFDVHHALKDPETHSKETC